MNELIENLIHQARRRFVWNEALAQLAFVAAVVIAGLALLLVLGTRYLDWWAIGAFALAGAAVGSVRVYRATPDEYATAVRVDRNAQLGDALSTAIYFSRDRSLFQQAQRDQAENAASQVRLDRAVPFTFPKAIYAMAGLALLASGLVMLRYRSARGLDLAPPITEVLFEDQAAKQATKAKPGPGDAAARRRLEAAESLLAKLGIPLSPEDRKQSDALDKAIEQALEGPGDPGTKGQSAGKQEDGKAGSGVGKEPDGDPLEGKQSDEPGKPPGKDGAAGDKGGSKTGAGDSSSLLSKLKDAVSDMFSKAAPGKPDKGQAQQQGQSGKSEKSTGEKSAAGKSQDQGQSQADAQDTEPNGDAQEGQQAQGKAGAKSAQQSSQAGSGVGSQDGAKDLRAAEQLKAMGKISEIIGKRSATVTGETTIEVESGNQQLRTAYTSKTAAHREADSDVNRDEIPAGLQSYVRQYFEQVRKAPKTKAPEKTATP